MKKISFLFLILLISYGNVQCQRQSKEYQLVWSDEFDYTGRPDDTKWTYQDGFVRNSEPQWYQPENAWVENGVLTITAKREKVKNPNYDAKSGDWRLNREYADYTSACVVTIGKHAWLYGRFEVRARVSGLDGSWPAIWFLGDKTSGRGWPYCGEIDLMEHYQVNGIPSLLANACWGGKGGRSVWNDAKIPTTKWLQKDPYWYEKYHVWRMDWDKDYIRLYMDNELLNEIDLSKTVNPDGINPFRLPQSILLNLALRGSEKIDPDSFPIRFDVDYVRIYQKK